MLALDQSSHATGWAIFRDEQLIEYGVINLEEGDVGTRLVELKNKIMNLITKYNVNFVAFEDIQLQNNNVVTFKVLAEVFGLIHYLVNLIIYIMHQCLIILWLVEVQILKILLNL